MNVIFTWNNGTISYNPCCYCAKCVPRQLEPSGTTRNQTNSMEQDARTYYQTGALVLPFSFVVCVGLLIITYKAEGDRVMPTKVHEVDVRTSAVGMKTPTNPI